MFHNSTRKYEIIYADFPWSYTACGTARLPYKSMNIDDMKKFPWNNFMAKRSVIFAWMTCPLLLGQQADVTRDWCERHGLRYLGLPYIWVKTTKEGAPLGATGPRPRLVKPVVEFLAAFDNSKHGRCHPLLTEAQQQVVFAPRGRHSEKPAEVRDRIVELLGDRPRLELFARQRVPGWDAIGDEL